MIKGKKRLWFSRMSTNPQLTMNRTIERNFAAGTGYEAVRPDINDHA